MTWLKTYEVANLLGITERAIRIRAENNKYKYRYVKGKGRGGKSLEIALECLPQKAQDKYNNAQEDIKYKEINQYTGKQREEANFKAYIVKQYQESHLSPDAFVKSFNERNPDDVITKSQLFRWQKKLKDGDGDALDLIDGRGGHNRGKDTVPDEAWDIFYGLYMTLQKRSIQRCWELTKKAYGKEIPSVSAFERKVRKIPKLAIIYYRDGETAFKDACPHMDRGRFDINSNDIWFSDHHKMDVAIKNKQGKVVRPWLTVFYDARSDKVMSFILRDKAADATVIKQCLRIGIEEHGVPNEVYFDNGKDYREKSFSRDFPISLVNQLGISTIYANKFHGQAKTVERFFGTMTDRFCKLIRTYLGRDAKARPEDMRVLFEKLAPIAPEWDDFVELLKGYFNEYNNTPNTGRDMDNKCPDQVYYENLKAKKEIKDKSVLRLLCGTFEKRIVQKSGIQCQNRNYYHSELLNHQGETVIINYDPYNVDELNVFDSDMRAICVAPAKVVTAFRHTTQEEIRAAKSEIKKARKLVEQYAPVREMDAMQIIAKNQLLEKQYAESPDTAIVDGINPKMTENSRILVESRKMGRDNREGGISATLMAQYEKEKKAIGG